MKRWCTMVKKNRGHLEKDLGAHRQQKWVKPNHLFWKKICPLVILPRCICCVHHFPRGCVLTIWPGLYMWRYENADRIMEFNNKNAIRCKTWDLPKMWMQVIKIMILLFIIGLNIFSQCLSQMNKKKLSAIYRRSASVLCSLRVSARTGLCSSTDTSRAADTEERWSPPRLLSDLPVSVFNFTVSMFDHEDKWQLAWPQSFSRSAKRGHILSLSGRQEAAAYDPASS